MTNRSGFFYSKKVENENYYYKNENGKNDNNLNLFHMIHFY